MKRRTFSRPTRRSLHARWPLLAQLFRYGKLTHHGAFFNAKTGEMSALPVDPALWRKVRKRTREDK